MTAVHNAFFAESLVPPGRADLRALSRVREVRRLTMIGVPANGSGMSSPSVPASPPPAALAAFLRGCERRGAVYAELQCGDPERGDVALAAALRAFRAHAATLPMADWPVRFWTLLAATPQLRGPVPGAGWPPALDALPAMQAGDRAALLLRLAGGLEEDVAAQAMGAGEADYREALARACPRDAQGRPDAAAWRTLADAIQQHLRDLPPDRLARLARLREDALAGTKQPLRAAAQAPSAVLRPARQHGRRRWPWVLAFVLLALAAAGLGGWWWWQQRPHELHGAPTGVGDGRVAEAPAIEIEPLPPTAPPAAAIDPGVMVATHADFDLLADPEGEALAQQADFLAWYLATAPAPEALPEEAHDAVP